MIKESVNWIAQTDSDDVEGPKDKKQEISGDRWGPAKSPPMVKLVNLEFSVRSYLSFPHIFFYKNICSKERQ